MNYHLQYEKNDTEFVACTLTNLHTPNNVTDYPLYVRSLTACRMHLYQ